MSHSTEVVEYKKVSNGQFSICIRCCGNPSTDHWHTMAADVVANPDKKTQSIAWARDYVQKQHENASAAEGELLGEMGKVVDHS